MNNPGDRKAALGRIESLDGLRGLAAVAVVAFHFFSAFAPRAMGEPGLDAAWWVDTPINALFNGNFAVHVFFVLSAFVLSASSFAPRTHLARDLIIRYLRLALPATVSVLIAWGLLLALPDATLNLQRIAPAPWLHWTHQQPVPGLFRALADGLFGIFATGSSFFNNVLWTMQIELFGSFGVYLFFQYCRHYRGLLLPLIASVLLLAKLPSAYLSFVLGAGLCLTMRAGLHLNPWRAMAAFGLGLALGFPSTGFAERFELIDLPWRLQPGNPYGVLQPLAALLLVAGVIGAPALRRFFAHPVNLFLGRLSFPLYLVHVPLIYTVCAAAAMQWNALAGARLFIVVGLPYLLVCLLLAWLFAWAVDEPVLQLLKRLKTRTTQPAARPVTSRL